MSVKASEIESYKGDSALAGGYGAQGVQQVISGVWKMTDAVNEAFSLLRAQQFQKSQKEYEQKIKDRDEIGRMITNKELDVDKLSDEDRIKANQQISDLTNQLIDAAKNGKLSDTDTFLELKKQYAEIASGINNKNVNNIAIEADRKKYENQFDEGYEKHDAKERELMAKDQNHKYQPYVPLFTYDDKNVYKPIVTDKIETPVGKRQKEVVETPNIAKTFDDTGSYFVTPNGRKEILSAHAQLLNGSDTSAILLDNANKKLEEIALTLPEDQRALLKPIDLAVDNPAVVIAKMRTAMGWSKVDTKPKRIFNSEQDAKLYEEEGKNALEIQKNKINLANSIALENVKSRNTINEQNNAGAIARRNEREKGADGVDGKNGIVNKDRFPLIFNAQNRLAKSTNYGTQIKGKKALAEIVDDVLTKSKYSIPVDSEIYSIPTNKLPDGVAENFKEDNLNEVIFIKGNDGSKYYIGANDKLYTEDDLLRMATGTSEGSAKEWNDLDRINASQQPQVEKTNSKKPEWTGEFDSKGNMIFK